VRPRDELVGLLEGAELRQDVAVVGDVVPASANGEGYQGLTQMTSTPSLAR
jgi:hypothetical protein